MLIHLEAVFVPRVPQVQIKHFFHQAPICDPDDG